MKCPNCGAEMIVTGTYDVGKTVYVRYACTVSNCKKKVEKAETDATT